MNAKWHDRPTIGLEIFLISMSIGWGVYVLFWFYPVMPIVGMPTSQSSRLSPEYIWAYMSIMVGCGKIWFIKKPSAIVSLIGAILWACIARLFFLTSAHSIGFFVHAGLAAGNVGVMCYVKRKFVMHFCRSFLSAAQDVRKATKESL